MDYVASQPATDWMMSTADDDAEFVGLHVPLPSPSIPPPISFATKFPSTYSACPSQLFGDEGHQQEPVEEDAEDGQVRGFPLRSIYLSDEGDQSFASPVSSYPASPAHCGGATTSTSLSSSCPLPGDYNPLLVVPNVWTCDASERRPITPRRSASASPIGSDRKRSSTTRAGAAPTKQKNSRKRKVGPNSKRKNAAKADDDEEEYVPGDMSSDVEEDEANTSSIAGSASFDDVASVGDALMELVRLPLEGYRKCAASERRRSGTELPASPQFTELELDSIEWKVVGHAEPGKYRKRKEAIPVRDEISPGILYWVHKKKDRDDLEISGLPLQDVLGIGVRVQDEIQVCVLADNPNLCNRNGEVGVVFPNSMLRVVYTAGEVPLQFFIYRPGIIEQSKIIHLRGYTNSRQLPNYLRLPIRNPGRGQTPVKKKARRGKPTKKNPVKEETAEEEADEDDPEWSGPRRTSSKKSKRPAQRAKSRRSSARQQKQKKVVVKKQNPNDLEDEKKETDDPVVLENIDGGYEGDSNKNHEENKNPDGEVDLILAWDQTFG